MYPQKPSCAPAKSRWCYRRGRARRDSARPLRPPVAMGPRRDRPGRHDRGRRGVVLDQVHTEAALR